MTQLFDDPAIICATRRAPEILSGNSYNCYLVDVWSLGVTLYAMLNLMTPFNVDTDDYGVKAMTERDWDFSDDMKAPPSDGLKSIMKGMLEPEPDKRLSMKATASHQWLAADYKAIEKLLAASGQKSKKWAEQSRVDGCTSGISLYTTVAPIKFNDSSCSL